MKSLYFLGASVLAVAVNSTAALRAGVVHYVPLAVMAPVTKTAEPPTPKPPTKTAPKAASKTAPKPALKPGVKPTLTTVTPALLTAPDRFEVNPTTITLDSRRAYRQFVVTGYWGDEARDLTHAATYRISDEKIARFAHGRVFALKDGRASLDISFGNKRVAVPVTVSNTAPDEPIRFKFETVAVLTKQGCASGSCHGSPHGKGGFSLSLFGYDPRIDKLSLTREGFNRRLNVMEPGDSLMLKKPLLEISHGGGKRLQKSDTAYQVLRDWIYEGANVDLPATECKGIVLTPGPSRVLQAPILTQQLSVLAAFSDGSVRDVSALATYETSHPDVATVSADGLITGHNRGQAAISVRYLSQLQSIHITVIEKVPGFVWNNPPENNIVDRLVNAKLRQLQYLPSETCTDAEFVRRVYLDLTGLLPSPENVRAFLKDKAPDKRSKLIDALLDSEEYARFWALKIADLMRVSPKSLKDGRAEIFARWLVDDVRRNTPHDKFARALLTASGDTLQNAPANYYLAIADEKERAEMTSQIFMGSRIECAKCHNHPFENWTMRDYYSIAAVFARTKADNGLIQVVKNGETSLPTTQEKMQPWGMADAKLQANEDRRAIFANWLTQPDNPFFARVEVNRIWADLTGRGIVDPVDDFRSSNPPSNVPLLDTLAQEFIKSAYDRKHIIRLICNSRTYQLSTRTNKFNENDESLFSHARVRLLTAEQVRDAIKLATHSLPEPDAIANSLSQAREQEKARLAELETQYPQWITQNETEVDKQTFWMGGWFMAGPFSHNNREKAIKEALAPETQPVDLKANFGDLKWQLKAKFRDDAPNLLSPDDNQVFYVFRRLFSTEPLTINVQLEVREDALVWLNGKLVREKPLQGNTPLKLELQKGENQLLIKVVNGGGDANFTFRPDNSVNTVKKLGLPPQAVELLALPAAERSDEQKVLLHDSYIENDNRLRDIRQQIVRFDDRLDYATQRPYPEVNSFSVAFGQPMRDGACTCERQNAPTLLQALELLNGDTTYQAAQNGSLLYQTKSNDELIEELYLSAFSRFPTAAETTKAKQFLEKSADRKSAVTDLIWTIVNTREFLFQH